MTEPRAQAQILEFPGPDSARARRRQAARQEAADTALVMLGQAQKLSGSQNSYVHQLGQSLTREITKTLSVLAQEGANTGCLT